MINILDFHTHRAGATGALISVNPRQFVPQPGKWYSVGVHPWDTANDTSDSDLTLLEQCVRHPQVLAIGETGLDKLRGGDIDTQTALFIRHLQLAQTVGKTVVVHSVRATQQILSIWRDTSVTDVTLAIHGMRGNDHVARMWLDAGCYLSFGPRFNPAALHVTPLDRLLIETDDSNTPIQEVAQAIAQARSLPTSQIITAATENARRLLIK